MFFKETYKRCKSTKLDISTLENISTLLEKFEIKEKK
jgi:hypothetical protein